MAQANISYYDQLRDIFPHTSDETIQSIIHLIDVEMNGEDEDHKFEQMVSLLMETGDSALAKHLNENEGLLDEAAGGNTILNAEELSLIYDQLMQLFPDASPTYIKNLCTDNRNNFDFDAVVEELGEGTYPRREVDPLSTLDHLKEMLPNADPTYLEEQSRLLAYRPLNELKLFVENAIEKNDYPTMEDYLKNKKRMEEESRYTTDFDIHEFLQHIPDPFEYFYNPDRKQPLTPSDPPDEERMKEDEQCAINFLYNHYPYLRKKHIETIFKSNNKNLIKSCDRLDRFPRVFKQPRKGCEEFISQNISLLQEIAFLRHKKEIRGILKLKDEKYRRAKEDAKRNGYLQTCACCFDNELIPEECYSCKKGCIFCKDCVKGGAETRIGDGHLDFPCLAECNSEFSIPTLQMVLEYIVFARLAQRKQMDEIKRANIDGLETCPFCEFSTIPPPDDKIFKCLNQDCMKESCRECRHVAHIPLRCNEIEYDEDVKMRTYIENKMTEALLRKCWKCSKVFIKESGCNKMTCSCGAKMCYLCGQAIEDYKHFGNGRCPLFTDNLNKLHVDNVMRGAQEAKAELGVNNNPNKLKFDPTKDIEKHYN